MPIRPFGSRPVVLATDDCFSSVSRANHGDVWVFQAARRRNQLVRTGHIPQTLSVRRSTNSHNSASLQFGPSAANSLVDIRLAVCFPEFGTNKDVIAVDRNGTSELVAVSGVVERESGDLLPRTSAALKDIRGTWVSSGAIGPAHQRVAAEAEAGPKVGVGSGI